MDCCNWIMQDLCETDTAMYVRRQGCGLFPQTSPKRFGLRNGNFGIRLTTYKRRLKVEDGEKKLTSDRPAKRPKVEALFDEWGIKK